MRHLMLVTLLFFGVPEAWSGELQPQTTAFLRELGLDPASKQIARIIDDRVGEYSLDALAAKRDQRGVKVFIVMHNFVRDFRQDAKTPFPPPENYWDYFMKPEEIDFFLERQAKESK